MSLFLLKKQPKPKLPLPAGMVGDKSTMYEQFIFCAKKFGDNEEEAVQRLKMIPKVIKKTDVWYNRLTNQCVYEYGIPYLLENGTIVYGSNVYYPVDELYLAVKVADKRLTREQLLKYLRLLEQKDKHCDFLFEMRPIKDVRPDLKVSYEVEGYGNGNSTVDWEVKGKLS